MIYITGLCHTVQHFYCTHDTVLTSNRLNLFEFIVTICTHKFILHQDIINPPLFYYTATFENKMFDKYSSVSALLILASTLISRVEGHGYVTTPRSRQWVAAEVSLLPFNILSYFISTHLVLHLFSDLI